MPEGVSPEIQQTEYRPSSPAELDAKLSRVESISRDFNLIFVHSIRPDIQGGQNNMKFRGLGWKDKLDYLLEQKPVVSASTINPGDTSENMWGPVGVVLKGGRVVAASSKDSGSIVAESGIRDSVENRIGSQPLYEEVSRAIGNRHRHSYNELAVSNPEIAGLYVYQGEGEYEKPNSRVSDEEMFNVSVQKKLPLFIVRKGEAYAVRGLDLKSKTLVAGERLTPGELTAPTNAGV